MSDTRFSLSRTAANVTWALVVLTLVAGMVSLSGCSRTKVYNNQKTVVYRDSIYNVSNVQKISTRVEGRTSDGEVINMKGMDKRGAGEVLEEHSPLVVSTVFEMDNQELVYQRSEVTSASEFSKMMSNFEKASNSITKFMANKKSTQLKLR